MESGRLRVNVAQRLVLTHRFDPRPSAWTPSGERCRRPHERRPRRRQFCHVLRYKPSRANGSFVTYYVTKAAGGASPGGCERRHVPSGSGGLERTRSTESFLRSGADPGRPHHTSAPSSQRYNTGCRVCQSWAASYAWAIASRSASRNGWPMTCRPIGRPPFVNPHGTEIPGSPARLRLIV